MKAKRAYQHHHVWYKLPFTLGPTFLFFHPFPRPFLPVSPPLTRLRFAMAGSVLDKIKSLFKRKKASAEPSKTETPKPTETGPAQPATATAPKPDNADAPSSTDPAEPAAGTFKIPVSANSVSSLRRRIRITVMGLLTILTLQELHQLSPPSQLPHLELSPFSRLFGPPVVCASCAENTDLKSYERS